MTPAASIEASPKSAAESLFDRVAVLYDGIYGPFLEELRRKGVEWLGVESGMRVLEVGIGTGLSLSLYPKDVDLVGIDPAPKMLAKARKRVDELEMKQVELVGIGAEVLPFPDGEFDRVLLSSVLSVVPDPVKVFEQVTRVTKPGGLACVVAHFGGRTRFQRLLDAVLDPVTVTFLGYRMTTPRAIVESNTAWEIIEQQEFGSQNYSTAYLLRRQPLFQEAMAENEANCDMLVVR